MEIRQQYSGGPDPSEVSHSKERGLHKVGTCDQLVGST